MRLVPLLRDEPITDRAGVVSRLDRAGFGHLLRPDIIDACRHHARKRERRG